MFRKRAVQTASGQLYGTTSGQEKRFKRIAPPKPRRKPLKERFRWLFNIAGFVALGWFISVAIPASDQEEIKEFLTEHTGWTFASQVAEE